MKLSLVLKPPSMQALLTTAPTAHLRGGWEEGSATLMFEDTDRVI